MKHLIGKHGAVMIDGKVPVCVECEKEVMTMTQNKKIIKKEMCSYCGQIINKEIWLCHTKKLLRKQGLSSLAKLLGFIHKQK